MNRANTTVPRFGQDDTPMFGMTSDQRSGQTELRDGLELLLQLDFNFIPQRGFSSGQGPAGKLQELGLELERGDT